MSTQYHIYSDAGTGIINYGSIVATVSGLTWSSSALAMPSNTLFAVRAFDSVTGYEESNVDAVVRVVVDPAGVDITARPNAPTNLSARATAGGGCRVEWDYLRGGQGGPPTGFKVWLTSGGSVNYAVSPAATIGYSSGLPRYHADLTGLSDGVAYTIGVRATNATATEPNVSAVVSVTGDSTAPSEVDVLSGSAVATG